MQWKSISIVINIRQQMFPSYMLFLLFCGLQIISTRDPFTTLINYQNNQRLLADLGDRQYKLLPFRLSGTPQHFILAPKIDQFINVEIIVHWISNNSVIGFPEFDLTQKVRLIIEQQSMGAVLKRSVLTKQFLTQTGFKLHLEGGHRYRWRIQSSGKISKLIEVVMVTKMRNSTVPVQIPKQMHQNEVEVLKEMRRTLEKAKQARTHRQSKVKETSVSSMWAWMSGMQMLSLLGFLVVQVALFQKFMLPSSVV